MSSQVADLGHKMVWHLQKEQNYRARGGSPNFFLKDARLDFKSKKAG